MDAEAPNPNDAASAPGAVEPPHPAPNPQPISQPIPQPIPQPNVGRDRLRLGLLLLMLLLWTIPTWAQAQIGDRFVDQVGAVRTGIAAALGLLVLWGATSTSLLARTPRGLRGGLALTHGLVAGVVTWLLITEHPWIPGGALRSAWVPIFAPLALLALLDAVLAWRDANHGAALGLLRCVGGLGAAGALFVANQPIPAAIAAWLGLSGLLAIRAGNAIAARRQLEGWALVAAVAAGLAIKIQEALVGIDLTVGTTQGWPSYAWGVLAAIVATTALDGLLRPTPDDLVLPPPTSA